MRISRKDFDSAVHSLWKGILRPLPAELRTRARELLILTQDSPQNEASGSADEDMLGMFEGIPLGEQHAGEAISAPHTVVIYRIPLSEECRNKKELMHEIRITLIHELGHYLGFTEEELEERGLG